LCVKKVSAGKGRYAKTLEYAKDNPGYVSELVYDCREWLSAYDDGLKPLAWRPVISGSVGEDIAKRVCR
jgi:hypothetical protein